MTISGKYELSHALAESSFRSFHARHTVTGRQLMVHFLTGGSANGRSLAEVMAGLNAERQAQLLDAGDHEGTSYLVTVPIDGFTTLQAWLGEPGGGAGSTVTMEVPRPKTAPPPQSAALETPGLKTGPPPVTLETPRPRTASPPVTETSRPKTGSPPQPSAGDFTQVFGSAPAPPAEPAPAERPAEAGSFTQMFGSPPVSAPPAKAPPGKAPPPGAPPVSTGTFPGASHAPPAADGPADGGSFTQFFNQPGGGAPPAPRPHAPPAPMPYAPPAASPPPPRTGDAGEFTQFFEVPHPPARPAPPSAPPPASQRTADRGASEFTDFFRAPDAALPLPPPSRLDPPPPPRRPSAPTVDPLGGATEFFHAPSPPRAPTAQDVPSMPVASGPSDFTMMLGGRGSAAAPPPHGSPAPPVSEWPPFSAAALPVAAPSVTLPTAPTLPPVPAVNPSAGTRRMILIAVLSFVVTLGFMVIVYLVFRSGR